MRVVSRLVSPLSVVILAQSLMFLAGGCSGGGSTTTGTQVKEDPEATKKREQMIQDMYKNNPPNSPANAKK